MKQTRDSWLDAKVVFRNLEGLATLNQSHHKIVL